MVNSHDSLSKPSMAYNDAESAGVELFVYLELERAGAVRDFN